MDRLEEYRALLQELETTPARLESAVPRARARVRRQKLRRAVGMPLAGLAAACVCFVLLVNVSAPFAAACADLPFLKELAQVVSFNPSLSAAVEHHWVQSVGQTQSANGAEMTVEYLIVDQKQLNIFYTTGGDAAPRYQVDMDLLDAEGGELSGYFLSCFEAKENGVLQTASVDFLDGAMPDALRLVCSLIPLSAEPTEATVPAEDDETPEQSDPAAVLTFDLSLDPNFTQQSRTIPVGQWLELDGQRVLLKEVEIYPTHIQVNLEDDPDNTAWLVGLDFYVQDTGGQRYETPSGVTAIGSPNSPFTGSYRLDSSFFSQDQGLTLVLTGARWLDKDKQWANVDLITGETDALPGEYTLVQITRTQGDVELTLRAPIDDRGTVVPVQGWRSPDGQEGDFDGWRGYNTEEFADTRVTLKDYPWDSVELKLSYTRETAFAAPVTVALPLS
jgi:hypothetical protein